MIPTPEELGLLEIAAELRAAGNSWGTIATQVGRNEVTCRHWPCRYPEDWSRLFRAAQKRIVADISIMSFRVLRQMHASENPKLAMSCAQFIVAHAGRHDK